MSSRAVYISSYDGKRSHSIGYRINGGDVKVLEERAEKNKDQDHSVGVVIVERT